LPEIYGGGAIFSEGIPTAARQSACHSYAHGAARPHADPQRPRASATYRVRDLPAHRIGILAGVGQLLLWVDCDNNHTIDVDKKDHRRFI
jgi:hypothetical protein